MADTSIEWADAVWNPVVGCTRASEGCDNCYAVKMSHRLERMGKEKYAGLTSVNGRGDRHFNGVVRTVEDALTIPLTWKKPRRIFVNSMSDLFHKEVPFEFIDKVFAIMALCPHHTFMVLTKRPERMDEYFASWMSSIGEQHRYQRVADHADMSPAEIRKRWPLPNVWLGTSCEDQKAAGERIPHLLRCPAAVRFLSLEPLLEGIDLTPWLPDRSEWYCPKCDRSVGSASVTYNETHDLCGSDVGPPRCDLHWVIAGGESGPKARPAHPDWVRSLRDQCQAAGVAFFFKQWGRFADGSRRNTKTFTVFNDGDWCEFSERSHEQKSVERHGHWNENYPTAMSDVGKKAAGRILDGRTWDEFPGARP